ncbi:MAG: tetrahydromethanopterin S-methyltransferase subunit [Methanolobus sp.]|nr:tetrahydromethanopterin S-methyltransferase subunit [Methanolobus sp.]
MIDIVGIITADFLNILLVTLGGVLISMGVHLIPVGGAPAAMAQATGVGTGTVQLAAGAGLTGLVTAGFMMNVTDSMSLILASGTVGAMIMISVTMLVGQWIYVYGVGCPAASAKVKYDPITKDRQDLYVSQGTEGHGIPTASFISGVVGAALGGLGGSLIYFSLLSIENGLPEADFIGITSIFAIGLFFVNAVIPSYNIGGTIEGFHDPKFKRFPKAVFASFVATFLAAIMGVIAIGGM